MRTRTGLIVVATIRAAAPLAVGANPLPVANGQVTTATNGGCAPGSHRDPRAVADVKARYGDVDAATEAKAIASLPCVADSTPATTGSVSSDGTTGLQPPVSRAPPGQLQPPGIKPQSAQVQPPGIKPH